MAYNVLIVEDQDIPRELFEIYIRSSDQFHHLLSIANASAALVVCQNSRVDLILMDVMTELDHSGLDAAEQIKRELVRCADELGVVWFKYDKGEDKLYCTIDYSEYLEGAGADAVKTMVYRRGSYFD